MSFDVVETTLASAVADAGTFTVPYPTGREAGSYAGGYDHRVAGNATGELKATAGSISLSFGASNITVTNNSGNSIPAGTTLWVQLDRIGVGTGNAAGVTLADPASMAVLTPVEIVLGAPDAADADGVCASQAGTADTAMTIAGALASGGVATFDVPRNVVAAWTNTATLTVTGTDEYGNTVVETSGSGTSMAGKKAFKTVTSVVPSANITGATVGTGDVLGLPVFVSSPDHIVAEIEDGAAATAGTVVAGVTATPTATTGDVRGTYDPNSAADGSKEFRVVALVADPGDKGLTQYAG